MTALAPRPAAPTGAGEPAALLRAALDGDQRAWELLVAPHLGSLRAVASRRVRDPHDVDDVVQEVLLRAWSRLDQLEDATRVGPWMKAIAARVAVDRLRGGNRRAALGALVAGTAATERTPAEPLEVVVRSETAAELHDRLAQLSDRDREALWRRDALGESVDDVAAAYDLTNGSARVMLARARTRLRAGYGALAAPLLGLTSRWRDRIEAMELPTAAASTAAVTAAALAVAGAGVVVTHDRSDTTPPTPAVVSVDVVRPPAERPAPTPVVTTSPTVAVAPSVAPSPEDLASSTDPSPSPTPQDRPVVAVTDGEDVGEPDVAVHTGTERDGDEEADGAFVVLGDVFDEQCEPIGLLPLCDPRG